MNADTTNLYRILGVSMTGSSQGDVRRAYRRLASIYHPDRANAAEVPGFETKFRQIIAAYEILGDPQKREVYDKFGTVGVKVLESPVGRQFTDFSHIVRATFAFITFLVLLVILFFCFLSARIDGRISWDFKAVFIPLWILDGVSAFIAILLIPVAASGFLHDDKYDGGDTREPMTGAEGTKRRQQRLRDFRAIRILNSILDVIKVFALIVFQVSVVGKANDPSSIATPIIFVPYFVWEGLNFLGEFIATFNTSRRVSFHLRLTSDDRKFIWILMRMAFATLIILRVEKYITYSWHVVCIPLYLVGVVHLINLFMAAAKGPVLLFSTLMVVSLWLPLVMMLAAKLDGKPYTASHVLIPVFVFLSTMLICTGCLFPTYLLFRNPTMMRYAMEDLSDEEARRDAEEARRDADRYWEKQLLTTEGRSSDNSYAWLDRKHSSLERVV